MNAEESGRIGGRATAQRYGREYMASLGKKGGRATRRRGTEFYRKIGKRGGAATKRLVMKAKRIP